MKFSTVWESDYLMNSNGFFVGFNMPEALKSKDQGSSEYAYILPPYARRKAFLVDEYLACPSDWMRSSGRLTSYFIPIQEGKGLWLDFNKNQEKNYHVAIVISIQGVNPITGMPCTDAHLEQYIDTCPKHNEKFGPNRYCEKCGYKWPKQNYISTTGNNVDELWLDGFRTAEGVVRQYILSKEDTKRTKRGVATNIIGEDRVYAIGLSFFLSKDQKKDTFIGNKRDDGNHWLFIGANQSTSCPIKKVKPVKGSGNKGVFLNSFTTNKTNNPKGFDWQIPDSSDNYNMPRTLTPSALDSSMDNISTNYCCVTSTAAAAAAAAACPEEDNDIKSSVRSRLAKIAPSKLDKHDESRISDKGWDDDDDPAIDMSVLRSVKTVKVDKMEVSAGASIKQIVGDDPEPLDFWRKEPEAIICVNYCSEESCEQIIKAGKTKKSGHKEGFLKEVPVGN